jgi:hypothetical protein
MQHVMEIGDKAAAVNLAAAGCPVAEPENLMMSVQHWRSPAANASCLVWLVIQPRLRLRLSLTAGRSGAVSFS